MAEQYRGPTMIAATSMLRPPPVRVSQITDNISLPRSVPLMSLVAGGIGATAGMSFMLLGLTWLVGFDFNALLICTAAGAGLGVLAVNWSPLRGESMLTWLGLGATRLRQERVEVNGRPVRAYIGIAPLHRTALGPLRLRPSAVDVPAGAVDERGVLVPEAERTAQVATALGVRQARVPGAEDGFAPPRRLGEVGAAFPAAPLSPRAAHDATVEASNWGWNPSDAPRPVLPPSPWPAQPQAPSSPVGGLLPWEIAGVPPGAPPPPAEPARPLPEAAKAGRLRKRGPAGSR